VTNNYNINNITLLNMTIIFPKGTAPRLTLNPIPKLVISKTEPYKYKRRNRQNLDKQYGKGLTCCSEKLSRVAQAVCSHHVLWGGWDWVGWGLAVWLLHTHYMLRYEILVLELQTHQTWTIWSWNCQTCTCHMPLLFNWYSLSSMTSISVWTLIKT